MLRNLQILQIYRLTDLYDFRSPGAHPRACAVYNTKRCGEAGALRCRRAGACEMSVVAGRERCVNSFPRAHAHEEVGAAGPVRFVAAARACGVVGAGRVCCISSSGVSPVGWGAVGLRSCWEAGPRARAHAESRIGFGTKSAYFWANSGCTARIRKAWRWRGSEESPARGSAGSPARSIARAQFLTRIGRLSK